MASSSFLDTTCLRCNPACCEDGLVMVLARKRRAIVGFIAGVIFAIGWWVFIDGMIMAKVHQVTVPIRFEDWVCGILGTLALAAVNIIDKNAVQADSMYDEDARRKARLYVFLCLVVGAGSAIGSIVILAVKYTGDGYTGNNLQPGIAVVVQNIMILISSLFLWVLRGPSENDW